MVQEPLSAFIEEIRIKHLSRPININHDIFTSIIFTPFSPRRHRRYLTPYVVSNIPVIVSEFKNYTSSDPTWLTSPFFRAGYEDVIKVFTGSNVPSTDYTFTFSSALPGIPNLAYGIKNYRGTSPKNQETTTSDRSSMKSKKSGSQLRLLVCPFRFLV